MVESRASWKKGLAALCLYGHELKCPNRKIDQSHMHGLSVDLHVLFSSRQAQSDFFRAIDSLEQSLVWDMKSLYVESPQPRLCISIAEKRDRLASAHVALKELQMQTPQYGDLLQKVETVIVSVDEMAHSFTETTSWQHMNISDTPVEFYAFPSHYFDLFWWLKPFRKRRHLLRPASFPWLHAE